MIRVVLLPGDGIGPEVVEATARVIATAIPGAIAFERAPIGWGAFERTGRALPDDTLARVRAADAALLGAVSSPSEPVDGYRSPVVALRRALDLHANLRPLRSVDDRAIDVLIVRENTEGLYVGRERRVDDGEAVAERVITRAASAKVGRVAFAHARRRAEGRGAGRVTIVHKANVLRITDGLFRESVLAVGAEFPDVAVDEQLVDSMAYRLVREPERFDVVVAPNLYGDVLSDLGAALVGGLGVVPSANVGDRHCVVEPVHGSAPDIAGRGIANPIATLRSAAMLLAHVGLARPSLALDAALDRVLRDGPSTPDLGGDATTDAVADAVASAWRARLDQRSMRSHSP